MACHAQRRPTVSASPKAMMACHARRRSIVCVLPKGGDVVPSPTSFDHVCGSKAVMSCHARCHPTVRVVQGR